MDFILDNICIILIIYAVLNVISFALFAIDKRKAVKNKWRIPEATLIGASVFGIFGGFCGMYLIRHKTKKPKFYLGLPAILIAEIAIVVFGIIKFWQ